MTLRIVCQPAEGESLVELHGWLTCSEVGEFEASCRAAVVPLRIDLQGLVGADGAGILALRDERSRGARLTGASPYIQILIQGRGD